MNVTFFDKASGLMRGHWSGAPELLALNTPAGCDWIEGHHELYAARVDIAQLSIERTAHVAQQTEAPFKASAAVLTPQRPPAPSSDHEWNAERNRWQLSAAASRHQVAVAKIEALEQSQSRALREAALGLAGGRERLQAIETQIVALRADLTR